MQRIIALLEALRYGAELANPAAWKKGQNTINMLVTALGAALAAAAAFGVEIPATDADLAMIAGAIVAAVGVVNNYITTASSRKVGLGAPK